MSDTEKENIRYDAFISYRHLHPDMDVAMQLQKLLETYKPPRTSNTAVKRSLRIFTDKTELPLNSDLGEGICIALRNSDYLIIVCSPETKHSKWCMEEVRYFKELHNGSTDRILIVLAAGRPEDTFFHEITHTRVHTGGAASSIAASMPEEREIEPLCADVAAGSTEETLRLLKKEFLRVAAPILGCGYDELVQRNKKRRQKRLAAASAIACVLLLAGIISARQISAALRQRDAQVAEQQAVISEQSAQSIMDDINLKTNEIAADVQNGRKIGALQKMAALWSAHSGDEYAGQILENLELAAIRANYVEQFSTWSEIPAADGGIVGISPDGDTVAVCQYPENGTATVHLYDKLLLNETIIEIQVDDNAGLPEKIVLSDSNLEVVTAEGSRFVYDMDGNLTGQSSADLPDWAGLYNDLVAAFSTLGSFDYTSQGMYNVDGNRIAALFSDPASEYDPFAAGGFLIYDRQGNSTAFPIPAPIDISGSDMFYYNSIALVPGRDIVLISITRGIYACYITAYSTVTGEELCTVDIDASVDLGNDCDFTALDSGWVLISGATAGDAIPFVAYFNVPAELDYNWTYGKRLFNTYNSTYIHDIAVRGDTLYVLTDNNLQAVALHDVSLTDKLSRSPAIADYDDAYENNPLIESGEYGLSVPDQALGINNRLNLQSTAVPWYYGDQFYTGMQMQLRLNDENGDSVFSMHQLDMNTYPYYSEKDKVFGFVSYDNPALCALLPLKDAGEILKAAQALENP